MTVTGMATCMMRLLRLGEVGRKILWTMASLNTVKVVAAAIGSSVGTPIAGVVGVSRREVSINTPSWGTVVGGITRAIYVSRTSGRKREIRVIVGPN